MSEQAAIKPDMDEVQTLRAALARSGWEVNVSHSWVANTAVVIGTNPWSVRMNRRSPNIRVTVYGETEMEVLWAAVQLCGAVGGDATE